MIIQSKFHYSSWSPAFYNIIVLMLLAVVILLAIGLFCVLWNIEKEKKSSSLYISKLKTKSEFEQNTNRILTDKLKISREMEDVYNNRRVKLGNEIFNFNYDVFKLLDKNKLLNK